MRIARHRWRAIKIAAAGMFATALLTSALSGVGVIATSNAVISAQLVTVRAPIEGIISAGIATVGTAVVRGQVLARIENARADDQALVDLRTQFARLHAEGTALAAEYDRLRRLQTTFTERAQRHNGAAISRLAGLQAEAERDLGARATLRDRVRQQLARRASLEANGFAAHDEVDGLRANLRGATQQADAARGRLDSLRAEAEAARAGVFTAPGANDVPYSVQRADEVDLHLSTLAREMAFLGGAQAETRERLAAAARRHERAIGTELAAPADGLVWRVDAAEGEHLARDEPALAIVDCAHAQLIAAIPQERAAEVELNGLAQFTISGRDEPLSGRVLSVTGDTTGLATAHLAAVPLVERGRNAIVRVAAPASPNGASGCLVGVSARVSLPLIESGTVSRLLHGLGSLIP